MPPCSYPLPTSGSQMSRSLTLDRRPTCGVTMVGESSLRKCQTGQDAGRRRRGSIRYSSFNCTAYQRRIRDTQKLVHRATNAVMSSKGGTNVIEALELGDRVSALC